MLLSNKWRCHSPSFPAAEIPASPPGLWTWTPPPPIALTNSKVKHFFLRHPLLVISDVILFPDFICMSSLNGFIICLCFHFITSASHLLFLWFTFPFSSPNASSLAVKLLSRPRNLSPLSKKCVLCRMAWEPPGEGWVDLLLMIFFSKSPHNHCTSCRCTFSSHCTLQKSHWMNRDQM